MTVYDDLPLNNATRQFRLLLIHDGENDEIWCTMSVQDRKASTWIYTAISYAWGDKATIKTIRVNGQAVQISYNAWYALWQMRCHRPWQLYWIDSVCIDQTNDQERNDQVAIMDRIYASSLKVAACIGSMGSDFEDYMELVNRPTPALAKVDPDDYLFALDRLSERAYVHRIWIVQELLLAPYVFFFCGKRMVPMHEFAPSELLRSANYTIRHREQMRSNKLAQLLMDIGTGDSDLRKSSLPAIVVSYADRKCSDPRDKIYGLLSLASDRHLSGMPINYSQPLINVLQVYVRTRCRMPETNLYDFGVEYFSIVSLIQEFARDPECSEALADLSAGTHTTIYHPCTTNEYATVSLPGVGQMWNPDCCGKTFPAACFPTSFIPIDVSGMSPGRDKDTWWTIPFPDPDSKNYLHVSSSTRPGDFLLSIRLEHRRSTTDDIEMTIIRFVCRRNTESPTRWNIVSRAELSLREEDIDRPSPGCAHGVGMHTSRNFGFAKLVLHPRDLLSLGVTHRAHRQAHASLPMAFTENCSYFEIRDQYPGS